MTEGDTSALLGPADIRRLAEELGVRPTKKLGQNFVHDPNTVRRIVAAAALDRDDTVLEVGPGLGSLTLALLPAVERVVAVEIDPVLAERLPRTVAERAPDLAGRLTVVNGDALRVTADQLGHPTALVANLPYNVSVPVVLHLLAKLPTMARALVMVQAEVADRMAAGPGSKVYGVPSVKIAWYAEARRVATVPRSVFWPVPNVDSALVLLTRRPTPDADRHSLFQLVDAAFAQRRKTLRAALASWAGSADQAAEILTRAGVDPTMRGETLTVSDYVAITRMAGKDHP
ncbi:16S rRNA (adenine(1518)-N(6)/adenine(1519)-N(6))-dimethyltransferase RsmA [Actinophytocola oryzae]|uniref:Ribosomal RNA small subunit methyltransferase A n=1 Tax=Actinophytocola oryzae TaxID=502181 RepID=A0A4R7V942_9PSEU|nr:16S rRNA (adenine(1518)-N(6)/adenine(1519)-N(6))-dimethyltransferase RsmA [Actinophytocola oryzae]TDV45427.1 16S rRNA (adenine1518-N6/adenine1519-N6)-dimethyltransferase [Actinophytocola oryzae]